MNRRPRITVRKVNLAAFSRLAFRRLMWARVMVIPESSRRQVFRRGTAKGFRGSIPTGGQVHPISGAGARALWKKAQKKAKKNITSDAMKRTIPVRSPWATCDVCIPWKTASRRTSRHH